MAESGRANTGVDTTVLILDIGASLGELPRCHSNLSLVVMAREALETSRRAILLLPVEIAQLDRCNNNVT